MVLRPMRGKGGEQVSDHTRLRLLAHDAIRAEEAHQIAHKMFVALGQNPPQWARDAVAAANVDKMAAWAKVDEELERFA